MNIKEIIEKFLEGNPNATLEDLKKHINKKREEFINEKFKEEVNRRIRNLKVNHK